MVLEPGIHLGISDEIYHADPCARPSLSSGIAHRLITTSPLHAKANHPKLNDDETMPAREDSDQTDRGQLAHCMLLGGLDKVVPVNPKEFPAEKTGNIPDGWTNKAIRAERDRIRAMNKIPVFRDVYDAAFEMAHRARRALASCEIPINLEHGDSEVVLVWEESETGILCRAKADWWHKDRTLMVDYKSTAGIAQPDAWIRRQMGPMGYGLQSGHYRRGGRVLTGDRPRWFFLVQENFPPYACSVVGISESMDEVLEGERKHAYQLWAKHTKSGEWPGYGNRIAYATPTTWQMEDHEARIEHLLELGGQA